MKGELALMKSLVASISAIAIASMGFPAAAASTDKNDDKNAKAAKTEKEVSTPPKPFATKKKKAPEANTAPANGKSNKKKGVPDDSI